MKKILKRICLCLCLIFVGLLCFNAKPKADTINQYVGEYFDTRIGYNFLRNYSTSSNKTIYVNPYLENINEILFAKCQTIYNSNSLYTDSDYYYCFNNCKSDSAVSYSTLVINFYDGIPYIHVCNATSFSRTRLWSYNLGFNSSVFDTSTYSFTAKLYTENRNIAFVQTPSNYSTAYMTVDGYTFNYLFEDIFSLIPWTPKTFYNYYNIQFPNFNTDLAIEDMNINNITFSPGYVLKNDDLLFINKIYPATNSNEFERILNKDNNRIYFDDVELREWNTKIYSLMWYISSLDYDEYDNFITTYTIELWECDFVRDIENFTLLKRKELSYVGYLGNIYFDVGFQIDYYHFINYQEALTNVISLNDNNTLNLSQLVSKSFDFIERGIDFLDKNGNLMYSSNSGSYSNLYNYAEGRYNSGYETGLEEGLELGFDIGISEIENIPGSFLTPIFEFIDNVFNLEVMPNVKIGYFIIIPLVFGVLGVVLYFWRKD